MDKEKTLRKLREEIEEVRKKYGVEFAEVVRCKDCKHRSGLNGRPPFMFYSCTCSHGLVAAVRGNDFCSYGERRDSE